jgi:TP901 family phage tail tape measure protein
MFRSSTRRITTSLGNITKSIVSVKGAMIGLGGTLAFRKVLGTYAEFEAATTDMAKVTSRNLNLIKKDIMAIDESVGGATDLMRGYYQVISAGVKDPKQALETLVVSSKAAKAAHVDQAEVIKGLTKIMAGFEGKIKDVTEASDLLFRIEKEGQTSFAELIPVIGGVAKLSSDLKITQDEMAASLATITQTAGSTAEAATEYRGVLIALTKPSTELTAALKNMGFETAQAAIQQLGLAETMKRLKAETGGAVDWISRLFKRSEAMLGVSALAAKNFQTMGDNLKSMGEKAGGTNKAFAKYEETINGMWDTFKNKLEKVLIRFAEEILPAAVKAIDMMSNNTDEFLSVLTGVTRILGAAPKGYLEFMDDYNKKTKEAIDNTIEWSKWLANTRDILIYTFTVVGALMAGVYQIFTTYIRAIPKELSAILKAIEGLTEMDLEKAKEGFREWKQLVRETHDAVTSPAQAFVDTVSNAFEKMVDSIIQNELPELVGAVEKAGKAAGESLEKGINDSVENMKKTIPKDILELREKLETHLKKIEISLLTPRQALEKWRQEMITAAKGDVEALKTIDQIYLKSKLAMIDDIRMAHRNSADDQAQAIKEMYDQIMLFSDDYVAIRKASIDELYDYMKDKIEDQLALERWYQDQLERIQREGYDLKLKYADDYVDALDAKFGIMALDTNTVFHDMANAVEDVFNNLESTLSAVFFDAITGKLKSLKDIINGFLNSVARSISDFLAKRVTASFLGESAFGGEGGGGFDLSSLGFLGKAIPYLGAGLAGFGIGGMVGVKDFRSQIGGALGGVAGYAGGTYLGSILGTGAATALGFGGGTALGATIGSILPVVGTAIGAVLGSLLGGLFGKGEHRPRTQIAFSPSGETFSEQFRETFPGREFALRHPEILGEEATEGITAIFESVQEALKGALESLDMDLSKFEEEWISGRYRITEGMDIDQMINVWLRDYAEFITGMDPKEFQKAGEQIVETIFRITQSIKDFPKVIESIGMAIDVVNIDPQGEFAQLEAAIIGRQADIDKIQDNITELMTALEEATDPSDAIAYTAQLEALIVQRYQTEIDLVMQLDAAIKQLDVAIRQTEAALGQFVLSMTQKIADLRGTPEIVTSLIQKYTPTLISRFEGAETPQDKLFYLGLGQQALDAYVNAQIQEIQNRYAALQAQAEQNRQLHLQGLNKQLQVIQGWQSLLDGIKDDLARLRTTSISPENVFKRLATAKGLVEGLKEQIAGAEGAGEIELAAKLRQRLLEYLELAGEAYQRPSIQYREIYDAVVADLEAIQKDAEEFAAQEQEIQKQIAQYSQSTALYTQQMAAEIQAVKDSAANYYDFMMEEGIQAYIDLIDQQKTDQQALRDRLDEIIGEGVTVQEFIAIKQQEAVTALERIKQLLEDVFLRIFGSLPQAPTPQTEGGAETAGAGRTEINLNLQTTVEAGGDAREAAKEIEDYIIDSVKSGRLRNVVKEAV